MGVLLRLSGAEHGLAVLGQHLRHDLREDAGPERYRERERLVVLRHGDEIHRGPGTGGESIEPRYRERADDLPHPIGAEIEAEDPVAVADTRRAGDDARFHKLVGLAGLVRPADRAQWI